MSRLNEVFAWKYFVVGIVALALTAAFTFWYGKNHPPIHNIPLLVEVEQ